MLEFWGAGSEGAGLATLTGGFDLGVDGVLVSAVSTGEGGVTFVAGACKDAFGTGGGGESGVVIIEGRLLLLCEARLFKDTKSSEEKPASEFLFPLLEAIVPPFSLLNIPPNEGDLGPRSEASACGGKVLFRELGLNASLIMDPGDTPRDLFDFADEASDPIETDDEPET